MDAALSPAEKTLAKSPAGAVQVQEFHRQLFANSADSLRQEIKRITGVEVREAAAEVELRPRPNGVKPRRPRADMERWRACHRCDRGLAGEGQVP